MCEISIEQYRAGLFDLLTKAERSRTSEELAVTKAMFDGLMQTLERQTEDEAEPKEFEETAEMYQACFDMTLVQKFDSGIYL